MVDRSYIYSKIAKFAKKKQWMELVDGLSPMSTNGFIVTNSCQLVQDFVHPQHV
jgi:hypothetical protein